MKKILILFLLFLSSVILLKCKTTRNVNSFKCNKSITSILEIETYFGKIKDTNISNEIISSLEFKSFVDHNKNKYLDMREYPKKANSSTFESLIISTINKKIVEAIYVPNNTLHRSLIYYYKNGKLLLIQYKDKNNSFFASNFIKNGKTTYQCCPEKMPNETIISNGLEKIKNYLAE